MINFMKCYFIFLWSKIKKKLMLHLYFHSISSYFICTIYSLFVNPFSWVVLTFIIGNFFAMIISTLRISSLTTASENLNTSLAMAKDHLQNYQVYSLKVLLLYVCCQIIWKILVQIIVLTDSLVFTIFYQHLVI